MKRKSLRLLTLAVPLVGLALVWRAGQRRRDEIGVYEAALRAIVPSKVAHAPAVFLSIHKQDPPSMLVARFAGSKPPVVPLSRFAIEKSSIPQNQIASAVLAARRSVTLDVESILWESDEQARIDIGATGQIPFVHCTLFLQRRGEHWKVIRRTSTRF